MRGWPELVNELSPQLAAAPLWVPAPGIQSGRPQRLLPMGVPDVVEMVAPGGRNGFLP